MRASSSKLLLLTALWVSFPAACLTVAPYPTIDSGSACAASGDADDAGDAIACEEGGDSASASDGGPG